MWFSSIHLMTLTLFDGVLSEANCISLCSDSEIFIAKRTHFFLVADL